MYSFNVISNKTQDYWVHETIKTLTVIKVRITDRKLNKINICSNIWKTEQLKYINKVMNFFNIFFNCTSKHVIKGAIPEIEKKQNKLTCESSPLEKNEQRPWTFVKLSFRELRDSKLSSLQAFDNMAIIH